jgi:tetratricopeptide (TPR) repeat protein
MAAPQAVATDLRSILAASVVVAFVIAAVFFRVLDNGFTNWDDDVYVLKNPLVRDFTWGKIPEIFTSYLSGNYHPLTVLFHALEFKLFGASARGYHAVSMLLHVANAALVLRLAHLLSGGRLAAAMAASLFFGLHPMKVESVAWVSGTKDLLSALFLLSSLVAYVSQRRRGRGGFPAASLVLFTVSLLAKASGLTFPLLLLLCDWLLRRPIDRRCLVEKLPFLAVAALAGGAALAARADFDTMLAEASIPAAAKLSTQVQRLTGYFLHRVVDTSPTRALYPVLGVEATLTSTSFLKAVALLALLGGGVALSARWTRAGVFGALFFLLALAPVFNAYLLGYSADRFAYFPSVGLAYLFGWAVGSLAVLKRPGPVAAGVAAVVVATAVLAPLAVASRARIGIWKDSFTLWADAMRWYPGKGGAYAKRAAAYLEAGQPEGALRDNAVMLQEQPLLAESWYVRGAALRQLGRRDEALGAIGRALQLDPKYPRAHLELARLLRLRGDNAGALRSLDEALRLDPALVDAADERNDLLAGGRLPPQAR